MTRLHIAGVLIFLSSCAPKSSEILLSTRDTPLETLVNAVGEQRSRIVALRGSGVLSFDSPELSGTASFESTMKKPDSLLVKLEGPFGIDVGTLFLSREKYVMYNSLENTVTTGTPRGSYVRSIIPFDLTYEQILDAFAGVFTLPPTGKNLQSYLIDDDQFYLSYTCGSDTCKYWVDPRYLMVSRSRIINSNNEIVMEGKASSFTEQDGIVAARRISIRFPKDERELSVAYSSMDMKPKETNFRYTVPASARKILKP